MNMADKETTKKVIFIGRSGSGKTTLTQVLKGESIEYAKTQYVNYYNTIIDTPGEYAENRNLGCALALYAYEADVVGLLVSACEPYSLFGPNITSGVNREVIGIITQTDRRDANVPMVKQWLENAGCIRIFEISAYTGKGIKELNDFIHSV